MTSDSQSPFSLCSKGVFLDCTPRNSRGSLLLQSRLKSCPNAQARSHTARCVEFPVPIPPNGNNVSVYWAATGHTCDRGGERTEGGAPRKHKTSQKSFRIPALMSDTFYYNLNTVYINLNWYLFGFSYNIALKKNQSTGCLK